VPLSPPAPEDEAVGEAWAGRVRDEQTTDEPPDVMALRRLSTALENLPAPERQVIKLRFFDGLDVESVDPTEVTVASTLGVSGKTVWNRMARAYAALREMMETKYD
jgi:RNA polymerase sigma factor (sigma-70 family)